MGRTIYRPVSENEDVGTGEAEGGEPKKDWTPSLLSFPEGPPLSHSALRKENKKQKTGSKDKHEEEKVPGNLLPFRYRTQRKVIIHCARHAEAHHNLRTSNRWLITDPGLTYHGIRQGAHLGQKFQHMDTVTHILCSPMSRTLHTAKLAFGNLESRDIKLVAYPDLRENGCGPASTGSPINTLFANHPWLIQALDTTLVPEGWETQIFGSKEEREARKVRVRKERWELGQAALKVGIRKHGIWKGVDVADITHGVVKIVVVSHASFLADLLPVSMEKGYFWNAEYRSYEFVNNARKMGFGLVETEESKKRVHVSISDCVPKIVVTPPTPPPVRKKNLCECRECRMRRTIDYMTGLEKITIDV